MENTGLNIRYIARLIIEAETPLKIGSGENGLSTDSLIQTDCNGLPVIHATSLIGVIRSELNKHNQQATEDIFGSSLNKGKGARISFSHAHLLAENGHVIEGLIRETDKSDYLNILKDRLPVRDHVRINEKGASDTKNHGKFDEQILFKGIRFIFDIELKGTEEDNNLWQLLLSLLTSSTFRIGGGTRKGFGKIRIVHCEELILDLKKTGDLDKYIHKSSSLNKALHGITKELVYNSDEEYLHYKLLLSPDDYFIFGKKSNTDEVDLKQITEPVIVWNNDFPEFITTQILIPATSVKGTIAHRVAYHYNNINGIFANDVEDIKAHVGENNKAVSFLFGCAENNTKSGKRGNLIFSDIYLQPAKKKVFNHVAIDRFTGGASEGALYSEETVSANSFQLDIILATSEIPADILEALELTLSDITTGMLPLGANTLKGHGCFNGQLLKNGKEI